jgi:hypothetical protein
MDGVWIHSSDAGRNLSALTLALAQMGARFKINATVTTLTDNTFNTPRNY